MSITFTPRFFTRVATVLSLLLACSAPVHARKFSSYAFINEDATLRIRGKHIRLYGIHIPETDRTCRSNLRPVKCAPRAALALDFKIQGFVQCTEVRRHSDRSITARCFNDDTDLSAYLIERGWAVAGPNAPFEYQTLERIAERRGVGIWGFTIDNKTRRTRRLSD